MCHVAAIVIAPVTMVVFQIVQGHAKFVSGEANEVSATGAIISWM